MAIIKASYKLLLRFQNPVCQIIMIGSDPILKEIPDNRQFWRFNLKERKLKLNQVIKQTTERCKLRLALPQTPLITSEDISRIVKLCPKEKFIVASPSKTR